MFLTFINVTDIKTAIIKFFDFFAFPQAAPLSKVRKNLSGGDPHSIIPLPPPRLHKKSVLAVINPRVDVTGRSLPHISASAGEYLF